MHELELSIEAYEPSHLGAILALSLRAWAPVFVELEKVLDRSVYQAFYPDGWRASQAKDVENVCTGREARVWVAREGEAVLGFVAVKLQAAASLGEIYMIAVDPPHQRRGVGRALIAFAVARMREAGAAVAMVETGGDPGHAPARRAYARSGFHELPVSRYFLKL